MKAQEKIFSSVILAREAQKHSAPSLLEFHFSIVSQQAETKDFYPNLGKQQALASQNHSNAEAHS